MRHTLRLLVVVFMGVACGPVGADDSLDKTHVASIVSGVILQDPVVLHWAPLHDGNCEMLDATLTLNPDGLARFTATTLTYGKSVPFDKWHVLWLSVKNAYGAELFNLGAFDDPAMYWANPPTRYAFNQDMGYDQTRLPAATNANMGYRCGP